MSDSRSLRVVMLPCIRWQPARDRYQPDLAPDPLQLDRLLHAQGIEVELIDPGERPRNPLAGRATLLEGMDPLRALRVALGRRDVDLVVSVFEGAALALTLLRPLLRFKAPIVLWDLGLEDRWRLRRWVLDRIIPRLDGIFVLSASQRDVIARRWGRSEGVEVIGYQIDTDFYRPAPPAPGGPVLAVGEDAGRDFETMLSAIDGLDTDVVLKTRRIAADRALPPRVRIVREWLDDRQFRDLYAAARIVVVPLHDVANASGVTAIAEAAAMGLPMVVTETDSTRDFIVPGETCLAVQRGDVAGMRAAISRLLAEPDLRARLAHNARGFAEERFGAEAFAASFAAAVRTHARPRGAGG